MTKIIADTTCGLPLEELAAMGVDVIPQIIIFNDHPYRDDNEIDTPTFLAKLQEAKELPKTAAPPPALYEPIYRACAERGESIVYPQPPQLTSAVRSVQPKSLMKMSPKRMFISSTPAPSRAVWASWSRKPSSGQTKGYPLIRLWKI